MIRLAMLDEEYGFQVEEGLPKRRAYVMGRLISFFVWESLLYLLVCVAVFVALYLSNSFEMDRNVVIALAVVMVVAYVVITAVGLFILKWQSIKKHKKIKKNIKTYLRELEKLQSLYEDDGV